MRKTGVKAGKMVNFDLIAKPGSRVCVVGSFNNWDPTANPMKDNPDSGHYTVGIRLEPGRYEYKFRVDNEWRMDPNCQQCTPNDRGSLNNVITV